MNLRTLMMVLVIGVSTTAAASFDLYGFDSPQQEAQYRVLIEELRCPKCQNQEFGRLRCTHRPRFKTKPMKWPKMAVVMLKFVIICLSVMETLSAMPPVRPSTWILWFFHPCFCLLLLGWVYKAQKGRSWSKQVPPKSTLYLLAKKQN